MNVNLSHARRRGVRSTAAFTMAEMLMATAIGAVVMAGIMTTYVFSVKSFAAASNYGEIQRDARSAVDLFTRDMRGVSSISSYSATNITVAIPTVFSSSGGITSNKTVSYWLSQKALYRYELNNGSATTTMVATNVDQMTLTLYDSSGNTTTSTNSAKGILIDLDFAARVIGKTQSLDYVSARVEMRNKS